MERESRGSLFTRVKEATKSKVISTTTATVLGVGSLGGAAILSDKGHDTIKTPAAAAAFKADQDPKPETKAKHQADQKPAKPKAEKPKTLPHLGLDESQTANAKAIVEEGKKRKLDKKAIVIAVSTAMQESTLYNRASDVVPESQQYPHQGSGSDHNSVGLFQQRPNDAGEDYGWGTTAECMDPHKSAGQFYDVLIKTDYKGKPVTVAAQEVQNSKYPEAYADDQPLAEQAVDALK